MLSLIFSLPKYEASHEYQTKKKRQQQRQQQEEQAKRMKVIHHPAPHTRLPPIQQQPLRPGPHQPGHNLGPPLHANGVSNQHNNYNRYSELWKILI
jgi:cyclin-dependent kinase 12/13